MVGKKLAEWKAEGKYVGKFAAQHHFFGYEGRCAAPSNYDADYCYSLGYTASCLIAAGKTGYMSSVRRWYPCNHDDEYGKTSWRNETGYPESFS